MNGLPGLFERIAALVPQVPGWCSIQKAVTLASMVVSMRPKLAFEVGVFAGSSLFPLALAMKEVGSGVVVGVEPWSNEVAVRMQTTNEDREWWNNVNMAQIRDGFYQRVRELQLESIITIHEKQSREVASPHGISILHVDGSHDDEAVTDVVKFAPHVEMGGFCVMDDENWRLGGVKRAIARLEQMGFQRLYALETGAVFQKRK